MSSVQKSEHGGQEHSGAAKKKGISLVTLFVIAACLVLAWTIFNATHGATSGAPGNNPVVQAATPAPSQPTANPRFVSDILDCPTRVRLQPNETISVAIPERTTMDFSPAATDGDVQVCSINDPNACVDADHSNLSGSINGVTVKNLRDHEIQFSCSYRSTDQTASNTTQDDSSSDEPVEINHVVP